MDKNRILQNENLKTNLALEDLELFICDKDELSKICLLSTNDEKGKRITKRNLVLPFSMFFTLKISKLGQIEKLDIESSFEKVAVRVSYRDFIMIQNTIEQKNVQL